MTNNTDFNHFMDLQTYLAYLMGIDIRNRKEMTEWIQRYSQTYRECYQDTDGEVTVKMLLTKKDDENDLG